MQETGFTAHGRRFFTLGADPIIKQAKRRVVARIAEIFRHPRGRFAEVSRHVENFGRAFGDVGNFGRAAGQDDARLAGFGREAVTQFLLHDFEQFPNPGRRDLFDGVTRKLAVTDGEVTVEPNFFGFITSLEHGAPVTEFKFIGLAVRETETEAEIVGEVRAADRNDTGGVRDAIAI